MMRSTRRLAVLAILAGLLFTRSALAEAKAGLPLDAELKLLLKIVGYDDNLPPGDLQFGVLYPSSDTEHGPAVVQAFEQLGELTVKDRSIRAQPLAYRNATDLATQLEKASLYGVFVVRSTPESVLAAVRDVAKQKQLLTYAQDVRHVEGGITTGIEVSDAKQTIVVNATAALEQGRKFQASFLSVCKILRESTATAAQ